MERARDSNPAVSPLRLRDKHAPLTRTRKKSKHSVGTLVGGYGCEIVLRPASSARTGTNTSNRNSTPSTVHAPRERRDLIREIITRDQSLSTILKMLPNRGHILLQNASLYVICLAHKGKSPPSAQAADLSGCTPATTTRCSTRSPAVSRGCCVSGAAK